MEGGEGGREGGKEGGRQLYNMYSLVTMCRIRPLATSVVTFLHDVRSLVSHLMMFIV